MNLNMWIWVQILKAILIAATTLLGALVILRFF